LLAFASVGIWLGPRRTAALTLGLIALIKAERKDVADVLRAIAEVLGSEGGNGGASN
jgi:hypothetical protein